MPSSISSFDVGTAASRAFTRSFVAVLAICVAGFAVASEALIHVHVVPNHNFYRSAKLFRTATAETAIFGDSQVAYGVAGAPGAINLAYGGDDFQNVADKVRRYLAIAAHPPKRVVVQAGLHHFSYQYVWRVGRDDFFLERIDERGPGFPALLHPVHRREIFNYWQTFLKGADFTPKTAVQADGAQLTQGSLAVVPESTRRQAAARLASELAPVAPPATTQVARQVAELLGDLARLGIPVCLVSMPVSPPLREAMAKHSGFAAARAFFAQAAAAVGARYVDYSERDMDIRAFADLNHLSGDGAKRFGARVVADCFGG